MDRSLPPEGCPRVDPHALLAHAGWMRSLAFSLLGDSAAADDVVQDAAVALLKHPPAQDVALEAWLSRVVRNFAWRRRRGESRRVDHEARAMHTPQQPSPTETLQRIELQRLLLEAVSALDEPFRTTVVERYLEGRTCAAIAQAHGLPAGTVRWRLKRGVDQLRERLDARWGSRESWSLLLAPFALPDGAAIAGTAATATAQASTTAAGVFQGALAMSTSKLVMTAVALAIAAGVVWWSFRGPDQPGAGSTAAAALAVPSEPVAAPIAIAKGPPEVPSVTDDPETHRSAALAPEIQPQPESVASKVGELIGGVDARFVDENGAPWSNVEFAGRAVSWLPNWNPGKGVVSGVDGRATLEFTLPDMRVNDSRRGELQLDLVASRAHCASVARSATLHAGQTIHLGDIVLSPGVRVDGRVVDASGKGIAGATVGSGPAELSGNEGRMRRHGDDAFDRATVALSGEDGAFVLEGVALGSHRVWAHMEGMRYSWTAALAFEAHQDVHGVELLLTPLLATDRIVGRVVDPDGEPLPGTELRYFVHSAERSYGTSMRADEHAVFALVIEYDDSTCDFTALDVEDRYAPTTVNGVQPGTPDLVLRLNAKRTLSVHLRDKDGVGIEGATLNVEQRGFQGQAPTVIRASGDYDISIPDDEFHLSIEVPGFRSEERAGLVGAKLPAMLEIVMRRAPLVRGRVLAAGLPLAGARVRLARDDPDADSTIDGYRFRYMATTWGVSTKTDEQGRFQLDCDLDGQFWLRADAESWAPGESGPIETAQLTPDREFEIEVTKGGAIEGRVLLAEGKDGEGAIVAINHGDGEPRTRRADSKGFYRFEGLAPGHWQVLASDSERDPSRRSYSSKQFGSPIEWNCEVSVGATTRFDLDLTRK